MRTHCLLTLALLLAACGPAPPSLAPEGPLFAVKDAAGAPPVLDGLWLSDGPVCKVDAAQPAYDWPACARWFVLKDGERRVFQPSATDRTQGTWSREQWIVAAGEPRVIQSAGRTNEGKPVWGYQAMSSIAQDAQGRITSLQTWSIDCTPPTKEDLRNHWLHEHPDKAGEDPAVKPEPEPDELQTYPGYDLQCQPRTQAAVRGAAAGSRTLAVRTVWRWVRVSLLP
jgi:hypothetical protein